MVASSAYKDAFIPFALGEMGCNTPFSVALWRIL
jgi:hypothetical protein